MVTYQLPPRLEGQVTWKMRAARLYHFTRSLHVHTPFSLCVQVTYQAGQTPRPVALVQLCLQEPAGYRCLLLHVARSGITPHLRQLLCCKVGRAAVHAVLRFASFINCRLASGLLTMSFRGLVVSVVGLLATIHGCGNPTPVAFSKSPTLPLGSPNHVWSLLLAGPLGVWL